MSRRRGQPEERCALILSPLLVGFVAAWGVRGLLVGMFVVCASAMAWADGSQSRVGRPWAPCPCRVAQPRRMTVTMGRRRYATAAVLALIAAAFVVAGEVAPVGLLVAWAAASTALAVPLRYGGCPELGLLASVLRGRLARSGCGPWCWADRRGGDLPS